MISLEIYRALVADALELITVVDESGAIVFENGAIERVTGYRAEERIGRSLFDFVHPADAGPMKRAFHRARDGGGRTALLHTRTRHRDGRWLPVESIARFVVRDESRAGDEPIVHGLVHSQDVSERHDLQMRLRLGQRLTTLGRLTATLADDFAEIVVTIRTHLRTLVALGPSSSALFGLRAIGKATEKAGALAEQLQGLGEMTPVFPDQVDIHDLLNDVLRQIRDQVWPRVMLKAERTAIRTDRASLREGLTNLVLSFRYAMPEGSIVAVATRDVSVPPGPDAPAQPSVDYIVVEVTNTGRGASGELDWRLFEPSAIAPASGAILLALVILHDIVNYTGGFIEVASTASGATTVNLYLPLTSEI